jgi:hypothetical protein
MQVHTRSRSGSSPRAPQAHPRRMAYSSPRVAMPIPMPYLMDHSICIHPMGPEGRYVRRFAHDAAPEEIAARDRGGGGGRLRHPCRPPRGRLQAWPVTRARSSTGQSIRLRIWGLGVRILSGAPNSHDCRVAARHMVSAVAARRVYRVGPRLLGTARYGQRRGDNRYPPHDVASPACVWSRSRIAINPSALGHVETPRADGSTI